MAGTPETGICRKRPPGHGHAAESRRQPALSLRRHRDHPHPPGDQPRPKPHPRLPTAMRRRSQMTLAIPWVRKRRKGTLEDISAVLWPEEKKTYLDEVLIGDRPEYVRDRPEYTAPEPRDRLPVNSLRDVLERIDERLRNIENRMARPDAIP